MLVFRNKIIVLRLRLYFFGRIFSANEIARLIFLNYGQVYISFDQLARGPLLDANI